MNPHPPVVYSRAFRVGAKRTNRGSTLMVVLSVLVLLLVLIVSFFSAATRMSSSSQHYASGSSALGLSQSAVEMVTSQIRLATSGASTVTWTSQPGLLRTFGSDGKPQQIFKLYSAPVIAAPASGSTTTPYAEADDSPAATWKTLPFGSAIYSDLNQPTLDAGGNLVYPIVDPNAATANATTGRLPVTGFTLGTAPGYDATQPASPVNNPAPMPVTWFYVLANGGIAIPQSVNATGEVTFSNTAVLPSPANPVVGRVAFWTDDDTCKLNVNTAGYGLNNISTTNPYMTYWDTPTQMSQQEETFLSKDQPWKGEYQRYPGHPATTGLNYVFPELTKQQLFSLTPRLQAGGSDGGNVNSSAAAVLSPKQDRLYASIDELFYNAKRNVGGTSNLGALTVRDLDMKRFFLTAHSRAPELNLFGQPRVTIWPISDVAANRSVLDKSIAFCSTIGKERYYFTRHDPMSQTTDINLTDANGVANTDIYAYLQRMTALPVPGFGGTSNGFLDKYGADRDQILTSIFDTVRITNLAENGSAVPYTSNNPSNGNGNQIMGQVLPTAMPSTVSATRGAGRMFCITEASLVFVNTDSTSTGGASGSTPPGAADKSKLVMGILFKFYQPAAGAVGGGANFLYKISGLSSMSVTGDITQAPFLTDTYQHASWEYNFASVYGGSNLRLNSLSDSYKSLPTDPAISSSLMTFDVPPTSSSFSVTGSTFKFNGGTIEVEIHAPWNDTSPTYVQKYTFVFPAIIANLPTPCYYPTQPSPGGYGNPGPWNNLPAASQTSSLGTKPIYAGRFLTSGNGSTWLGKYDVVRSLQVVKGDVRRVAYLRDVPSPMFQATPNYSGTGFSEHGLQSIGDVLIGATSGTLIAGLNYTTSNYKGGFTVPDVPIGINGVTNSSGAEGDWNNGYGWLDDGGYLPKPDEGVIYTPGAGALWGYFVRRNGIEQLMYQGGAATLFSANRQVPSAVLFGSIPTGVQRNLPWQTLLFRPARSYHMGGTTHPGAASPPDYLLLDLFQMPVVEPYAISEPFSTAGKANMNYRIKPFSSYITRDSAVRSVLESTLITAIPQAAISGWRPDRTNVAAQPMYSSGTGIDTRWPLDVTETLKFFETRFNSASGPPPVFVSESEICDIDLVPQGSQATAASLNSFWNQPITASNSMRFTGDNSLERPYATLYPRLTTRSNTFTVHVYAQALVASPSNPGGWNERTGQVLGQWRGEYGLERYLDPNDPTLPGFLHQNANLNANYKFHTLYSKRFAP